MAYRNASIFKTMFIGSLYNLDIVMFEEPVVAILYKTHITSMLRAKSK